MHKRRTARRKAGIALGLLAAVAPAAPAQQFVPLSSYSASTTVGSDGSFHRSVSEQASFLQKHKHKHKHHAAANVVVAYPMALPPTGGSGSIVSFSNLNGLNNGVTQSLPHTSAAIAAQAHIFEAIQLLMVNQTDRDSAELIRRQNVALETMLRQLSPAAPSGSGSIVIHSPVHYAPTPGPVVTTYGPANNNNAPAVAAPAFAAPANAPGVIVGPSAPAPQPAAPHCPKDGGQAALERLNREVREMNRRLELLEQTVAPRNQPAVSGQQPVN